MKPFVPMISAVLLLGSLGGAAFAGNSSNSPAASEESYCHTKFPAIQPRTLSSDRPQLKGSTTGDVIDYYGSCAESPTGKDQVTSQKLEEQFRFGREYEDGD